MPFRLLAGARAKLQVRGSEEISHWAKPFEQFNYSPQEFYKLVEKHLETRKIPGAGAEWRAIREGSILSPERLYLNIQRERLLFVLCAAPFGNSFFVSCRLLDYRSGANLFDYLFGIAFLLSLGFGVLTQYGLIPGLFTLGLIVTLFWSLFRQAVSVGGEWLDDVIVDVPVIGPIYESLFRPDTYFRRDTAEMFRQLTHNAVLQAIDEMTTQKGIRGLTEEERKPVVRNLYRR
ncbi:MAG: hypothetical protein EBS05_26485 [Proteobacteria bacterium]|nr:hypothetical protein [Pseudomonadota bacterium]